MNAGAHCQCISDILKEAKVYNKSTKEIITFTNKDFNFGYRKSIIQNNNDLIVLDAVFELEKKDKKEILDKINSNQEFRKNKQPNLSTPNCGSVFKNPQNNSAGKLLEDIGAKDFKIGGAKVYENHANFIINFDNATSTDVSKLIKKMYNEVKDKYQINLIPEVKFIGEMNEEEKEIWNELLKK